MRQTVKHLNRSDPFLTASLNLVEKIKQSHSNPY